MHKYAVEWRKTYIRTGVEMVEAENEDEAKNIVAENIGDLEGSSQYLADADYVAVLSVVDK